MSRRLGARHPWGSPLVHMPQGRALDGAAGDRLIDVSETAWARLCELGGRAVAEIMIFEGAVYILECRLSPAPVDGPGDDSIRRRPVGVILDLDATEGGAR